MLTMTLRQPSWIRVLSISSKASASGPPISLPLISRMATPSRLRSLIFTGDSRLLPEPAGPPRRRPSATRSRPHRHRTPGAAPVQYRSAGAARGVRLRSRRSWPGRPDMSAGSGGREAPGPRPVAGWPGCSSAACSNCRRAAADQPVGRRAVQVVHAAWPGGRRRRPDRPPPDGRRGRSGPGSGGCGRFPARPRQSWAEAEVLQHPVAGHRRRARPAGTTAICWRRRGWRPMSPVRVPSSSAQRPQDSAR